MKSNSLRGWGGSFYIKKRKNKKDGEYLSYFSYNFVKFKDNFEEKVIFWENVMLNFIFPIFREA